MIAGTLEIQMMANLAKLTKDMGDVKKLMGDAERQVSTSVRRIQGLLAGMGIGLGIRELIRYADTWANLEGRIKLVTGSTGELAKTQERLFQMAQRTRVGFEQTADTYTRIARSTQTLNVTEQQRLRVTESINKSLIISGAAQESAAAALMQLGQGFASGTLRGEELNSVLEQTPRLAQAIADGLGISVGRLRELGQQGKLTADAVFNALLRQGEILDREFEKMPKTIAQSFTQLNNSLMKFVGTASEANGGAKALADLITLLAENVELLNVPLQALIVFGGNVAFVLRGIGMEIAAIAAQSEALMRAVRAAATGDFAGAAEALRNFGKLREMAQEDAAEARRRFDEWEKSILDGGKKVADAVKLSADVIAQNQRELNRAMSLTRPFADPQLAKEAREKALTAAKLQLEDQRDFLEMVRAIDEAEYRAGLLSAQQFYEKRHRMQQVALQVELAGITQLIAAQKEIEKNGKPDEQLAATKEIMELEAHRMIVQRTATRERSLLKLQEEQDLRELANLWLKSYEAMASAADDLEQQLIEMGAARNAALSTQAQDAQFQQKLLEMERGAIATLGAGYDELTARTIDYHTAMQVEIERRRLNNDLKAEQHRIDQLLISDAEKALQKQSAAADFQRREAQLPDEIRRRNETQVQINEAKRVADAQRDVQVDMWRSIDETARDTFRSIFDSGKSTFERLRDTLKNTLFDLLYQMTLRPFLIQVVTTVAGTDVARGAFGAAGTLATQGGAGGISGIGGALNSLQSLGSLSNIGGLFSSFPGNNLGLTLAGGVQKLGVSLGSEVITEFGNTLNTFFGEGLGATLGSAAPFIGAAIQLAMGNARGAGFTAAGAAIGSIIPGIGTALGAVIGSLIGSLTGKNKIPAKVIDSSYVHALNANAPAAYGGSSGGQQVLEPIVKTLGEIAKTLGITLPAYALSYASNTGKNSQEPNFGLDASIGLDRNVFKVGEWHGSPVALTQENVQREAARAMLEVIRNAQLPKYLADFFATVKPAAELSKDQIDEVLAYAASLKELNEVIVKIADISGIKATSEELLAVFGDIQTAVPMLNGYYEAFFTAAEKQANALKGVNEQMVALGISSLPRTRAEFRDLVEAQDLATDAGKRMFAALISIAPAFAAVTEEIAEVEDALVSLQARVDESRSAALDALQEQIRTSESAADQARQSADAYRAASQSMQETIRSLRQGNLSTLLPGQKLAESRNTLGSVFAAALSGDRGALAQLPNIAQEFLQASRSYNASSQAYTDDFSRVMAMLEQAGVASDVFAGTMDYQATLLDIQTGVLQNILAELEKPSPQLDKLNEQLAVLEGVRDLIADAGRNILTVNSSVQGTTGAVISGNSMISAQTGEITALPTVMRQQTAALLGGNYMVTDPQTGQLVNLTVDSAGRITSVRDAIGGQTTSLLSGNYMVSDPNTGRIFQATVEQTGAINVGLSAGGALAAGTYQVLDATGRVLAATVDNAGRVTSVRDALGVQTNSLLAGNYNVTDPVTGQVLQATVSQTGAITSYDQRMLDQAQALLGASGPLAAGQYAIQDQTGRVYAATVSAGGNVTALSEIARDQSGRISTGNDLMNAQTREIILGNTTLDARTGQVVQGINQQTGQVVAGNSTSDAIRNLTARDTNVSEAMLVQLAQNSTTQSSQFATMVDGINRTVQAMNTLIGLQQELNAADAARRAQEEAAAAKMAQIATQQAALSSAAAMRDTVTSGVNTGIANIWTLAAQYGVGLENTAGQRATFEVRDGQFFSDYNVLRYTNEASAIAFKEAFWASGGVYDQTFGKAAELAALTQQLQTLRDLITGLGGIPSHAEGLDYVPYDGYVARLHRGEYIATASEAAEIRAGRASGSSSDSAAADRLCYAIEQGNDLVREQTGVIASVRGEIKRQGEQVGRSYIEGARETGRQQRNFKDAQRSR
ncbi:MAG TPA: tape measure protein [Burkholderiales bacterium]|nr:tape measure protein [Burkholderiales bacterium]